MEVDGFFYILDVEGRVGIVTNCMYLWIGRLVYRTDVLVISAMNWKELLFLPRGLCMSQILKLLSFPLLEKEESVFLQGHFLYLSKRSLDSNGKEHIMELRCSEWRSPVWPAKGDFQHETVV